MKVLMFGWEFPPYNRGGLGVACHGMTKSLADQGAQITFVIPKTTGSAPQSHVNLVMAEDVHVDMHEIDSPLIAYMTSKEYHEIIRKGNGGELYGKTLFEEVRRYAQRAQRIARTHQFDVIHAHDWMTYQAGVIAKKLTGKPLIVHVHATEFDRAGGKHGNKAVHEIEYNGMHAADKVIAVSNFTKQKIMEHYHIPEEKIEVVHNGIALDHTSAAFAAPLRNKYRIVLFLGRLTMQKGPDWFVEIARKVLEKYDRVKFVIAGSGDMEAQTIRRVAELGLGDKILFAGYLQGDAIDHAYRMADLYVMPSVSEPFGLTPLEAMRNGTPVIVSKQSGVSEVIKHCLKADFWDVNEMANKIIAALRYPGLYHELRNKGYAEVQHIDWTKPAQHIMNIYQRVSK